ncbi:hypothetical protein TGS27_1044 [Geobacillus stearothermophilus]|nr:hypothetical protein TGS27_1044 [Geobacillus stearothermophilus]
MIETKENRDRFRGSSHKANGGRKRWSVLKITGFGWQSDRLP